MTTDHQDLLRRIERDLVDGYDEELEMAIEATRFPRT
jgi:hypothetical protein